MEFIKDNKGKLLIAAAAAVGGLIWIHQRRMICDRIPEIISDFIDGRKEISSKQQIEERVSKLKNDLAQILKSMLNKSKTKEEMEKEYILFFMTLFQTVFQRFKSLKTPYQDIDIESYEEVMSSLLAIGLMKETSLLDPKSKNNEICFQKCFEEMFTGGYQVLHTPDSSQMIISTIEFFENADGEPEMKLHGRKEQKVDIMGFFFELLLTTEQSDLLPFIQKYILVNKQLKNIFLRRMISDAFYCIRLLKGSNKFEFCFNETFFEMMKESEFIQSIEMTDILLNLKNFERTCVSFSEKDFRCFYAQNQLLKWIDIQQFILNNPEIQLRLLTDSEDKGLENAIINNIFAQLASYLFILTQATLTPENNSDESLSQTFNTNYLTFVQIQVVADKCLETMNNFLRFLKKADKLLTYKASFMKIIFNYMKEMNDITEDRKSTLIINYLIQYIPLIITLIHDQTPNKKQIEQFWEDLDIDDDSLIRYFKMSLSQQFEDAEISLEFLLFEVEQKRSKQEVESFKEVFQFELSLRTSNSLFGIYNNLGFQYAILHPLFNDEDIQKGIFQKKFTTKREGITNLFFFNQLLTKIASPEFIFEEHMINEETKSKAARESMKQKFRKYVQNYLQVLLLQKKSKEETQKIFHDYYSSKFALEEIENLIEQNPSGEITLKSDLVPVNISELVYNLSFSREYLNGVKLDQNVDNPLYQPLDFIQEVQMTLFTNKIFVDYLVVNFFMNPEWLDIIQILIFYEIMIDFIYRSITEQESENPKIEYLYQMLIGDSTILKEFKRNLGYLQGGSKKKYIFHEQILCRIEKRISLIQNL